MRHGTFRWSAAVVAGLGVLALATPVYAQAWNYPSFTPPRVQARELNLGVAGAGMQGP